MHPAGTSVRRGLPAGTCYRRRLRRVRRDGRPSAPR